MAKIVYIGSARIDENGHAHGGKAGDQTGREVMKQPYYIHSKDWVVVRAIDADVAALIARDMEAACDNDRIGYDQWNRNSLYNALKDKGYDCSVLEEDKECDCSPLVRVCAVHAEHDTEDAFRTTTEVDDLLKTGAFIKLTASKYTTRSTYLKRGDILCTETQGHTGVVLNDGEKAEAAVSVNYTLGERILRQGVEGTDVRVLQEMLVKVGHDPKGVDGKFGPLTKTAIKAFQKAYGGLVIDGEYGPLTHAALMYAVDALSRNGEEEIAEKIVKVFKAGNWYIRKGPSTNYKFVSVVPQGTELPYVSTADNGWYQVEVNGTTGWISNKCAAVKEAAA